MPRKKPSLRLDENELAFRAVRASIGEGPRPEPPGEGEKNPEAVKRGRKGASKGGLTRKGKLTHYRTFRRLACLDPSAVY